MPAGFRRSSFRPHSGLSFSIAVGLDPPARATTAAAMSTPSFAPRHGQAPVHRRRSPVRTATSGLLDCTWSHPPELCDHDTSREDMVHSTVRNELKCCALSWIRGALCRPYLDSDEPSADSGCPFLL